MNYGHVEYLADKKLWRIQCEPHVSIRLKRTFAGLGKAARGHYLLSDTLANARDLEWFLDRYPMVVVDAKYLRERACAHIEQASLVDTLLQNRLPASPFELAIAAREYQRIAATMYLARGGLLLADDVGIGKTVSAICSFTDPRTRPVVVVTLTHLPRQWQREIDRFAPNLLTHIVTKGQPYDLTTGRNGRKNGRQMRFFDQLPDVLILNYHKITGWAETLSKVIGSVVYDECQELRTGVKGQSNKYEAAQILSAAAKFRIGLSATPIYNYGAEMYSVLDCIFPGELGTFSEFSEEWCGGQSELIKDPKAFSIFLRGEGMMLRRTRKDVGRELPECQSIPHYIDADTAALERLSSGCAELAKMILASSEINRGDKMRASEQLSNELRQATGIAKAPYVAEFVRMLLEAGEKKVVLYGWHRAVYSIFEDRLKQYKPVLYTGTESAAAKDKSKESFVNDPECRLLLISLRSGAGLDGLQQVCRTVVFGELDWSPGVMEQCIGRIYRDGQVDPVAAYYLICDYGSDPVMCDVIGVKAQQIQPIKDPDLELVETLEVDPDRIKNLARDYLRQVGISQRELNQGEPSQFEKATA